MFYIIVAQLHALEYLGFKPLSYLSIVCSLSSYKSHLI